MIKALTLILMLTILSQSCLQGCQVCNALSICSKCLSGYYYSSLSCLACKTSCKTCSSRNTCTACNDGYYLNSLRCSNCSLNCQTCSSASKCTSCKSGQYLVNNTCYNCPSGCSLCSSSQICLKCYQNTSYCVVYSQASSSSSSSINILIIIIPVIAGGVLIAVISAIFYRRCKRIQLRPEVDRQRASSSNSIISGIQISEGPLIQWKQIEGQIFGEDCIICLQTGNSYLSCGHIFHPKCLLQWFKHKKWCPMCHSSDVSKEVTVICENCRRMGFKKALSEVIEYRSQDIKICRNCKLKE